MKRNSILLSIFMIAAAQLAGAQSTLTDTTHVSLDEIVISANKSSESKKSVSQQMQVIDAQQIQNMQAQTTADVIANSGAIAVQKSQLGGGSPVIRGFEANRVLLVIDGVRMNNIIYRGGHLQNIVTLDNSILDRAEILFGPSSTMYGSDALGGVIHFYTRKPLFNDGSDKLLVKANAYSRYGSVNSESTNHLDFNLGWKKVASLTSFTYSSFGDLKGGKNQNPFYNGTYGERPFYVERIGGKDSLVENNDRYLQKQSAYTQYDLLQKFAFKQNDHITHGLNIQYSNSSDVPRYDRLTDPSGAGLKYAEWYYGPQARLLTAYDFNKEDESAFFQKMHAGVNYQSIEESRHTRRFGKSALQHRTEKVNVIGLNIDLEKKIADHTIHVGVDARYNTLKSTAEEEDIATGDVAPLDTRYPDGDNTMTNMGLYFSHKWTVNDQLTITDGVRLESVALHSTFKDTSFFHLPYTKADQTNTAFSGNIGLIHTPSDDLKLTALLSTGFRAPNVDDLSKVFESAPGAVIVPNSDLKPEKTINTELGVTKIFNEKTSWENTVYYTRFIDAIVTDKFPFNGEDSIVYDGSLSEVYANQNKGEAYVYGFSSAIKSKCSDYLTLAVSMNYTYGRIKTDSTDAPLDHIPPFMARFQMSYAKKNFSTDFFVNYNGWKRLKDYYLNGEDNEQYATSEGMPAWFTANIHVSYKVHKYITLQAGVDNMFDTQYRTFASGINAPGRNIFGAIRFHY